MSQNEAPNPPRPRLADLMAIGSESESLCADSELAAVAREQFRVVMPFGMPGLPTDAAGDAGAAGDADRPTDTTDDVVSLSFHDLLAQPDRPLRLLVMAKQFAKAHYVRASSTLAREVALLAYALAIAAAWVHHGQRITRMDDAQLRPLLGRYARADWVEEPCRKLLADCMQRLWPPDHG